MSKLLDLLRTTIRHEREWAETRIDHGDSTLAGYEDDVGPGGAGGPDGGGTGSPGSDDNALPDRST